MYLLTIAQQMEFGIKLSSEHAKIVIFYSKP